MKAIHYQFVKFVILTIIGIISVIPGIGNAQQEGTMKDSRDNHVYQLMKIGKKTWMAENLKFATQSGNWVYNNDSVNQSAFGRLYDWITATTACPKGWGLPTDNDWAALMNKLGGRDAAGGKLQAMDSVNQQITKKISESGKPLSTLLGGVRHSDGTFTGIGLWGGFWSGTSANDGAKNYLFAHGDKSIGVSTNDKGSGFSVRCIKK